MQKISNKPSYQQLMDFGYSFLGPIIGTYLQNVENKYKNFTPICLAREGWSFFYIINKLQKSGFLNNLKHPIYLKVSRGFLLKCLSGDITIWEKIFSNNFSGTLSDFLINRLCFTYNDICMCFDKKLLSLKINLPEDRDKLKNIFYSHLDFFSRKSSDTLSSFKTYINTLKVFNNNQNVMLDIGYSGTIQSLLTSILDKDTYGEYFVTTAPNKQYINKNCIHINGSFAENVSWGNGCLMLDRSLILESILTAPHGQIRDIYITQDNKIEFMYGNNVNSQIFFQDLLGIIDGAYSCIYETFSNNIRYNLDEIHNIFNIFTKYSIPENLSHLFDVDDSFSGNAILNAKRFYSL
ncbi:hypothetical protein [Zymomonas mobilis]|uniref:hypothetical protein n=1 Tax=Zymomonas mobilis TaxID=542 RepID=UPI0039EA09AA